MELHIWYTPLLFHWRLKNNPPSYVTISSAPLSKSEYETESKKKSEYEKNPKWSPFVEIRRGTISDV